MTTISNMSTWVVGLDASERSRGALVFTHWLAGPNDQTVGVHIFESWSRRHLRGEPVCAIRDAVARTIRDHHIAPPSCIRAIEAVRAEDGLAKAAEGATALVIGRAARAGERPLNRLGHVARRVLRDLPAPVIVVPPDLSVVASGPILLATDLDVATTAAIDFARQLAVRTGRDLEIVHIGMPRHSDLIDELDPSWATARDEYRAQVTRSLRDWMEVHGLADRRQHLAYGSTVEALEDIVVGCHAAMVVVGSRRLGTTGRIFLGSTASALAGFASCPVAVVPSR